MTPQRKFWIFLLLLICCIFGTFLSNAGIFYRLIYLILLIIVFCFIWTIISINGVQLSRYARVTRQQVGEVFLEHFKITNQYPIICLWLEVRDECVMMGKTGSKVLSLIGPHQKRTYVSYSRLYQRGEYSLGLTKIISGDPLGLFISTRSFQAKQVLTVLPYIVNLKKFPSPPGLLTGGRVIGRRTFEVTPQAAGVREYFPGDPLNRIHWPISVRHGTLMVKEFENDPRADVWIILDANENVHARINRLRMEKEEYPFWNTQKSVRFTLAPDSFEYAVSTAGSVADYFIRNGRAVGLISAGQTKILLSAERGERQHYRILETLAFLKDEGDIQLMALVGAQASSLPRGSTVVIISTTKNPQIKMVVDVLQQRRLHVVIILMDVSSFGDNVLQESPMNYLEQQGIPVVIIENKMDLKIILENGFRVFL